MARFYINSKEVAPLRARDYVRAMMMQGGGDLDEADAFFKRAVQATDDGEYARDDMQAFAQDLEIIV